MVISAQNNKMTGKKNKWMWKSVCFFCKIEGRNKKDRKILFGTEKTAGRHKHRIIKTDSAGVCAETEET